jgi:excisionase family DNA binding protein
MEPAININLINYEKAALLLGISPQTLRRMVSQRRVPHLHVGRLVRFDVRDLVEFLNSRKVPVVTPPTRHPKAP